MTERANDNWQPGVSRKVKDAADQVALEFMCRIDDLLAEESSRTGDRRYEWAADTLEGIRETVERTGQVTDGQRTAVDRIESSRRR